MDKILKRAEEIKNLRNELDRKAKEEQEKKNFEKDNLLDYIATHWIDEIKSLIVLANTLEDNGFSLGEYGKANDFVANSITHSVGFCTKGTYRHNGRITCIGFNGGGWCGEWSFRIDGDTYFEVEENHDTISHDVPIEHIKKFIERYPTFRDAFLKYVDDIMGTTNYSEGEVQIDKVITKILPYEHMCKVAKITCTDLETQPDYWIDFDDIVNNYPQLIEENLVTKKELKLLQSKQADYVAFRLEV